MLKSHLIIYSALQLFIIAYNQTNAIITILIAIISLIGTINMEGGKHELVELLATRTCIWERSVSISFLYHRVYQVYSAVNGQMGHINEERSEVGQEQFIFHNLF